MNKKTWINIFHFYQPPTIDVDVLKKVAKESYVPLIDFIAKQKNFNVTININSCLSYLLHENGFKKTLQKLGDLVNSGQVELTDTAAYHPILPLINEKEIQKQIKTNRDMNAGLLGVKEPTKGFWLPECAYSPSVARIIKECGYQWIVLDEISLTGKLGTVDPSIKYKTQNEGLGIIFRNRALSLSYVPDEIIRRANNNSLPNTFITATDGEIYWHRHKDLDGNLYKTIINPEIKTQTVSTYLSGLKNTTRCNPVPSNWDSTSEELKKNIPFAQWQDPKNKLHKNLWTLTKTAYQLVEDHQNDQNYWSARRHLEKGMSSCTYWWASRKDFKLFSGPAWKPDEVERGATELIKSVRSLACNKKIKIAAEKNYLKILRLLWIKHWSN